MTDDQLQQAFALFGSVLSAPAVMDGQAKAGRPIRVSKAKPKEDRPRGSRRKSL